MKYCEQCGTQLEDNMKFCSNCGTSCDGATVMSKNLEEQKGKHILKKKPKKKRIIFIIAILMLVSFVIGEKTGFFSDMKKGYNEAEEKLSTNAKTGKSNLTKDGTAYEMTIQEYCDRFNKIANESWCNGDTEILRIQVEEETRKGYEEAAQTDPNIAERITQIMTREMLPDITLLKSEDYDEQHSVYTYTNQYSFIPGIIDIQILTDKESGNVKSIAAIFPMDYRNVGDILAKLVSDSWGENSDCGEFQELYTKMKEAGGYGYTYKDGTVFELMYAKNSDKNALFKMTACTKEHYEEAWVNNPDLPTKENPKKDSENNLEDNADLDNTDTENQVQSGLNEQIEDLIMNFQGFSGVWGDFGAHVDTYQGMIEDAVKSTISLSDYFGGDVNDVYLYADGFQWDGINIKDAGCLLTFEGPNPTEGHQMTLMGSVSINESGDLQFIELNYY